MEVYNKINILLTEMSQYTEILKEKNNNTVDSINKTTTMNSTDIVNVVNTNETNKNNDINHFINLEELNKI